MKKIETFAIVNPNGDILGKATRKECHSGTFLLHPVVHLHVFNSNNELYLQKRSLNKDVQPGKWDTSVGGHVDYGEEIEHALIREAKEELGLTNFPPSFIKKYIHTSSIESELVYSYFTFYDENISPDPIEISEGRFWKIKEIWDQINNDIFTSNFKEEFCKYICELDFIKKVG